MSTASASKESTKRSNQRQRQLQSQYQSTASKFKHQKSQQQQQGSSKGGGNNKRRNRAGRWHQGARQVRQSPVTIWNGGFCPGIVRGSSRKQRKSSWLGGKISAQHQIQQQHPRIPSSLTHFAVSKCFLAPPPTALPNPPEHWTLSRSKGMQTGLSKRNLLDDFETHNCCSMCSRYLTDAGGSVSGAGSGSGWI